jgi:MFS family permease
MIPQLSDAFGVSALGVSSILGMYYYTYSTTSLVAGIALDKVGAKYPVPVGIAIMGAGCLLFAVSSVVVADIGRLLQGAGSAFAFTGCVYLATRGFSSRSLATAIGVTQCLGMLGGSAGQFVVAPWIQKGLTVHSFWIGCGIVSLIICMALFIVTPRENKKEVATQTPGASLLQPYKIVFSNVQSYLCGIVSGLLFAPTTIFVMTWGVAFFQQDRELSYHAATITSSMVPLGWVFGCPLLGWCADKLGRRKPVSIAGAIVMMVSLAQLLFLPALLPAYVSMLVFGIGSGAAMIPYSIIKEANPDHVKGSATGAINFLTFGVTALLGPIFAALYGSKLPGAVNPEHHFQVAGRFWLICIALAIVVGLLLVETGVKRKNISK